MESTTRRRRRPHGGSPLAAVAASLALAWAVCLGSAPAAAGEPEVGSQMQDELARQQRMLSSLSRGETAGETDLDDADALPELDLRDRADPRVAPAAPQDRPLPVAIFETRDVEIRRGTWGNRSSLKLEMRVLDADGDGHPELVRYVDRKTGRMVRQEEDRNYDGVTDAWSDYRDGVIEARALDSNDDGNPDTWERYADGRMTSFEVDRDDDGVRDAFYRYEGGSLVEERHDADNDGQIDLRVTYVDRVRVRSEEDRDRDGRMDTWRSYQRIDGEEVVVRIERDERGRGYADTFETFEVRDGRAVLARREEDIDGDGEIDVTSFYRDGKLVRREILAPELVSM
ncbi:MAG: hypothetical protein ACQGVK_22715 [Myxococcota bacterium]